MTVSDTHKDRRKSTRRRAFKQARIGFHELSAAIDCVIRDASDTGLRLLVESPVGVPDCFYIVRDGQPTRKCRVVWRRASGLDVELGVEFI
ncbi:MAG: PilZ domain-containing protein [Methylocystis sp.]